MASKAWRLPGTQAEVSAHQRAPGDEAGAHLAGGDVLRPLGDRLPPATRAGAAEALVFGHGVGDLGQIEDLVPLLRRRVDDEHTAARATGVRKVAQDLIDLGFRNRFSGVLDVTALCAPLLVRGGTPEALLVLA